MTFVFYFDWLIIRDFYVNLHKVIAKIDGIAILLYLNLYLLYEKDFI